MEKKEFQTTNQSCIAIHYCITKSRLKPARSTVCPVHAGRLSLRVRSMAFIAFRAKITNTAATVPCKACTAILKWHDLRQKSGMSYDLIGVDVIQYQTGDVSNWGCVKIGIDP
jgi:hypothetical protein